GIRDYKVTGVQTCALPISLVVEQEVILDAKRFVEKIVDERVNVVQVVPSYLEVLLSYLAQHPRELPDLRCVSVTGEALKKTLTRSEERRVGKECRSWWWRV